MGGTLLVTAMMVWALELPQIQDSDISIETKRIHVRPLWVTEIEKISLNSDGRLIAVSNNIAQVVVLNAATGRVILHLRDSYAASVCLSGDGQLVFVGEGSGYVSVYRIANEECIGKIRVFTETEVNRILLDPNGMLWCYGNNQAMCVDVKDPTRMKVCDLVFDDVRDIFLDDRRWPGILFNSGSILMADKNRQNRLVSPAIRVSLLTEDQPKYFGLAQRGDLRIIYSRWEKIFWEVQETSGQRKVQRQLQCETFGVYAWGDHWVICCDQSVVVLNKALRHVAEKDLQNIGARANSSTFQVAADGSATLVVGINDGDVVVCTMKAKAKKR